MLEKSVRKTAVSPAPKNSESPATRRYLKIEALEPRITPEPISIGAKLVDDSLNSVSPLP